MNSANDEIIIDLFDCPAVLNWYNFFKEKANSDNFYTFAGSFVNDDAYKHRHLHEDKINSIWKSLLNDIDSINNLGYTFPFDLPDRFNFSQNTLNQLHRFFTYNALWHHDGGENPFDKNFKISDDLSYDQWHQVIEPINVKVHELEIYCDPCENKNFVNQVFPINDWHIRSLNYQWMQFSLDDVMHNYDFNNFSEFENLVILDNSILGKSILQSFYEDDDPNSKDCTGRLGSFGGFIITRDDNRKQIYQSDKFLSWCQKHKLESNRIPHEFVIGYARKLPTEMNINSFASNDWSVNFN